MLLGQEAASTGSDAAACLLRGHAAAAAAALVNHTISLHTDQVQSHTCHMRSLPQQVLPLLLVLLLL
jgi:hypothetical protein